MDLLSAILPFFTAGVVGAAFARFSGVNLSMCMLFIFLYMGGTPGEVVSALLLFNTFTYFTSYSQNHDMNLKSLKLFSGAKITIPILITVALAALSPFLGVVFFVIVFLLEIFARFYSEADKKTRPTKQQLIQMVIIAAVLVAMGLLILPFIPVQFYYVLAGIAVIAYAALMWATGNRRKWDNVWDKILYATTFVTGLTGIDPTDWVVPMHRNTQTALSRFYPIVINGAMIIGLFVAFGVFRVFSLGALFSLIGAAMVIRLFGLTEHSSKGTFSYLAMGLAVLAALVFMIIQPQPTGFPIIPVSDNNGLGGYLKSLTF